VVGVTVPPTAPGRLLASYKVAKRIEQDISAVCGAFVVDLRDERIVNARLHLAHGGYPGPRLHAEAAVMGMQWFRNSN